MVLAVIALAFLDRVVDSTAELVRLMRPGPAAAAGGFEDAGDLDATTSLIDASLEDAFPAPSSTEGTASFGAPLANAADGARSRIPIANAIQIAAGRAPDEDD